MMSSLVSHGFSNIFRASARRSSSAVISPESNPTQHTSSHIGRLYEVPEEVIPGIHLPSEICDYRKTFGETHFLIRRSALEVFHYLRADVPKKLCIILFGPPGSGKSTTLSHVGHYVLSHPDIVTLNFGHLKNWLADFSGEMAHSNYKDGRIDHISRSLEVLQEFKLYNESKISELVTHRDYEWSARENTPEGSPLLEVLLQGINRPMFSADVLNVLMRELLLSSNENKCKFVVLGDALNVIFNKLTACHREKLIEERIHEKLHREFLCVPDELSVIYNLKKLLKAKSQGNVSVIGTVDAEAVLRLRKEVRHKPTRKRPNTESHLPFALLGEEGWKTIGPFIPVEVERYSGQELNTMIDFKLEKNYIKSVAGSDAGRAEIHFLTGRSPLDFAKYCHFW